MSRLIVPTTVLLSILAAIYLWPQDTTESSSELITKSQTKAIQDSYDLPVTSVDSNKQLTELLNTHSQTTHSEETDAHGELAQDTFEQQDDSDEQSLSNLDTLIAKYGVSNIKTLSTIVRAKDFYDYLTEIDQAANKDELEKLAQLNRLLTTLPELKNMEYYTACGKGLCGIMINDVDSEEAKLLMDEKLNTLPLGGLMLNKQENEYGNVQINALYQVDQKAMIEITQISELYMK